MRKLIFALLLLYSYLFFGQTLTFNEINSSNILNNLDQQTSRPEVSEGSVTTVLQIGNSNRAKVYDNSKKSDLVIRQTGDFNTTLLTNTNPQLENNQKVNIEGNNNYIDITGNNSNSKELQINLKTNDKMIFVRHY
ncbi:hypothetical protein [Chryseobacterium sp. R2A-55]|uniref:hypothetical protein n=1 Tax=Chryseobacterium sp. R2A-55 TaxID=2744445 RepID=UPI001F273A2C|nr:hypothetical protein [Chryseobacterium sp. R2A-55]